jgi:hypothetical protein
MINLFPRRQHVSQSQKSAYCHAFLLISSGLCDKPFP